MIFNFLWPHCVTTINVIVNDFLKRRVNEMKITRIGCIQKYTVSLCVYTYIFYIYIFYIYIVDHTYFLFSLIIEKDISYVCFTNHGAEKYSYDSNLQNSTVNGFFKKCHQFQWQNEFLQNLTNQIVIKCSGKIYPRKKW